MKQRTRKRQWLLRCGVLLLLLNVLSLFGGGYHRGDVWRCRHCGGELTYDRLHDRGLLYVPGGYYSGEHEWESTRRLWMFWDWLGWAVLSHPQPEQLLDRSCCASTGSEQWGDDALIAVFLIEPETPSGSAMATLTSAIPTDRWTTGKKRLLAQMLAVGEKVQAEHRELVLARISRFCGREFATLDEAQAFGRSLDDSP